MHDYNHEMPLVNPLFDNVEKWPNMFLKSRGVKPQDFKSMFGHFSTL